MALSYELAKQWRTKEGGATDSSGFPIILAACLCSGHVRPLQRQRHAQSRRDEGDSAAAQEPEVKQFWLGMTYRRRR